jgi:catechol 2,3-dioxygenase-like lactoylglutathione lyase family enzyme
MVPQPRRSIGKGSSSAGSIGALDEVHLPVRDFPLMREFYVNVLGFHVSFEHPGRMIALRTGGAMLVLDASKPKNGIGYIGFKAKDSKSLLDRLVKSGVHVILQPELKHWGELLSGFEDPEGNVLYMEEPAGPAARHNHGHPRSRPSKG